MINKAPGKTSSQRRGDLKRKLLMDVGTAMFTHEGFFNTGVEEIVQLAGVPKGSFYYYFDSKEDYVHEVIGSYAIYFAKKLDRTPSELASTESFSPAIQIG